MSRVPFPVVVDVGNTTNTTTVSTVFRLVVVLLPLLVVVVVLITTPPAAVKNVLPAMNPLFPRHQRRQIFASLFAVARDE